MLDREDKAWVDQANYQELIDKIRSEGVDSRWFQDDYLFQALHKRVEELCLHEKEEFDVLSDDSNNSDGDS